MKTNPDDSAFTIDSGIIDQCGDKPNPFGLSKREYFAAMALSAGSAPKDAVAKADALIAELNK